MARIIVRNTAVSGSIPTSLVQGELSLNVTDGKLYYGSSSRNIVKEFPGSGYAIISASYLNPLHQDVQLTGSLNISGSETLAGYLQLMPITANINNSISASYIYVSGSTNDLYFTQNGAGYANTTRLRWLEGNLYTGLLNGGIIGTASSTVFTVGSGSGVIVNINASYGTNPYPTVQCINWGNLSASIAPLSASYDQSFVAINSSGSIVTQSIPYSDGQFNTLLTLGIVLHQNRSTINAVQTFPTVGYGWKQRSYDFIKAFGPLKISGYAFTPSGSSTGSLVVAGGTAWVDGRNYTIDPSTPSYIVEAVGIATSKIYRYYQSGSSWGYDTNAGVGYATIDPSKYSNSGVLTPVGTNDWTIQRVYYFPNSGTKALYIYYGNATYSSKDNALAAVSTETFTEAPNTAANALYLGYMVLRHNANFTTAASYGIYEAGLFRASGGGVGAGGGGGTTLPGGSTTQIQYNNSSTFAGVPTLTYDGVTLTGTGSFSGSFTGTLAGTASFASTASFLNSTTNAFIQNGNSFGATALLGTNDNQSLALETSGSTRMFISSSGNVGIGTLTPAFTLDVTGSTRLRGTSNLAANTSFTLQNSDATNMLQVQDNGYIRLGSGLTNAFRIYPTDTTGDAELAGLHLTLNSRIGTQTQVANVGMVTINGINGSATSGNQNVFLISKGFAPTSGTGVYNASSITSTINQTGGANGITRGLYVNPTLTAAADFRAIETTAGNVLIQSGSTSLLFVSQSGRVGFGTSTPSASFHVATIATGSGVATNTQRGVYLQPTLHPSGSNVTTVGLEVAPTFDKLFPADISGTPSTYGIRSTVNNALTASSEVTSNLSIEGTVTDNNSGNNSITRFVNIIPTYSAISGSSQNLGTTSVVYAAPIFQTASGAPTKDVGASIFYAAPTYRGFRNVNSGYSYYSGPTVNVTSNISGLKGFYHNATLTGGSVATNGHNAFENVNGDNVFNAPSGSTFIGCSAAFTTNYRLNVSSSANGQVAKLGGTGANYIDFLVDNRSAIGWNGSSGLLYLSGRGNGLFIGDTPTDASARLHVKGSGATSATTTFLLTNATPTNILTVLDNGTVGIGRTPTQSLDIAGTTRMSGSFNTSASGSILTVVGSGSAQPIFTVLGSQGELFSITDSLSGSLFSVNDISGLPILEVFSDSTTLIGDYLDPMLITTKKVTMTNSGSFVVYSLPTASYDTAFFDYSIRSGSNARAGQIMAIQSASIVNYTETTTTDFGSTTAVSFGVFVTGSNMVLSGSATAGSWTIKAIIRGI